MGGQGWAPQARVSRRRGVTKLSAAACMQCTAQRQQTAANTSLLESRNLLQTATLVFPWPIVCSRLSNNINILAKKLPGRQRGGACPTAAPGWIRHWLLLLLLLVSEMAYYVSSGTLNPTHSLTHLLLLQLCCAAISTQQRRIASNVCRNHSGDMRVTYCYLRKDYVFASVSLLVGCTISDFHMTLTLTADLDSRPWPRCFEGAPPYQIWS